MAALRVIILFCPWMKECIYSAFAPPTGFNPRWDCTLSFQLQVPELALVRFVVEDHDHTAKNDFVGQFTLPFTSLRTGARSLRHTASKFTPPFPTSVFSPLRLPTCSFAEGRRFQSVTRHPLHPRQSVAQRNPPQDGVRACGLLQSKALTPTR